MINKINKLIGLKKTDFDEYVSNGKITLSDARLIPLLKTGDEMALTEELKQQINNEKDTSTTIN